MCFSEWDSLDQWKEEQMSTGKKQKAHYCVLLDFLHSAGNLWLEQTSYSSFAQSCLCFVFKYQKTSTFFLNDKKTGTSVCLIFLSQVLPWVIRGNTGEGRNTVFGFLLYCYLKPCKPLVHLEAIDHSHKKGSWNTS